MRASGFSWSGATPREKPAYVKDGKAEYFHIRTSGTTTELPASQIHDCLTQRFAS